MRKPERRPQLNMADRSVQALIRRAPMVFFRLAGMNVDPQAVTPGDVSVDVPEFRADQVFLVGDGPARWGLHLEYQLLPGKQALRGRFFKNAALTAQLDLPVVLVALYLSRGRRRTFPATYEATAGGIRNLFQFHTIRLWEHAARIRTGELRELAPLLVLCEDNPTEVTLEEERQLILAHPDPRVRSELLAVALTVGARYFARDLLLTKFQEELQMLKGASIIEDWIEEGVARGVQQGVSQGSAEGVREILTRQLTQRFGGLPPHVTARLATADVQWLEDVAVRLLDARSLEELGF